MKREKDYINMMAGLSIIGAILVIMAFWCHIKFSTYNFPKVTYALLAVAAGEEEYIVAKEGPKRVVIASPKQPEKTLCRYLEKNGYQVREKERAGARWTVVKDGKKETVFVQGNAYFSKWIWD